MTICTVAIEAELFAAVKMMIEMKIIDAESVGAYVEELIQKDLQRRKADERKNRAEGKP
jgi:hypothetical protein